MASIRICSKNNRLVKELEVPPRAFRRVFYDYMETDGKHQVISPPPPHFQGLFGVYTRGLSHCRG